MSKIKVFLMSVGLIGASVLFYNLGVPYIFKSTHGCFDDGWSRTRATYVCECFGFHDTFNKNRMDGADTFCIGYQKRTPVEREEMSISVKSYSKENPDVIKFEYTGLDNDSMYEVFRCLDTASEIPICSRSQEVFVPGDSSGTFVVNVHDPHKTNDLEGVYKEYLYLRGGFEQISSNTFSAVDNN